MKAIIALVVVFLAFASAQRPATTSICDYYANALSLTQQDLVTTVVVAVFNLNINTTAGSAASAHPTAPPG